MKEKGFTPILILIVVVLIVGGGFYLFQQLNSNLSLTQNSILEKDQPKAESKTVGSGLPFDIIIKSTKAQVLGETTSAKKRIPVQIYAYEDHNGNGVREPEDQALVFMPVNIYDSPFSETPLKQINSTDSGWASVLVDVGPPYQLIVIPSATREYTPTTKPIILSEKNNFAVVGFQKREEQTFHISIFAFQDSNKDSNFNYDDKNERSLFLAPFKFYQETEVGDWEQLPNSSNTTDTGWATTTLGVRYPYRIKVEAGDLNNLIPSNREVIITSKNTTLIFPYISK